MEIRRYALRVLDWLRVGYPQGVPDQDYQPLLALLSRRLTEDELRQVCDTLVRDGLIPPDKADIGVQLTKVLGELPSERDQQRVAQRLVAAGWPVEWDPETGAPD